MARPQHGIFTEGTRTHHHLEYVLAEGVDDHEITEALTAVRVANADHRTAGGTNLVIGFGPMMWDRVREGTSTPQPVPFPGYATPDGRHEAPASQRDIWVWVHGASTDIVIDVVRNVDRALSAIADLVLDVPGFVYHDSRDLTGFIDGTANPRIDEAAMVATLPDGSPGAGGSCAMTMRFVHDLDAFDELAVADQELVIGRTKDESVQLDATVKPADAHIARAEVADDDGEELAVYRRSVPWATAASQGLHFVSFGADLARFDLQLRHMYGLVDDGVTDRLLDFTSATTGSFWFCPSVDDLDEIAPLPEDDD